MRRDDRNARTSVLIRHCDDMPQGKVRGWQGEPVDPNFKPSWPVTAELPDLETRFPGARALLEKK